MTDETHKTPEEDQQNVETKNPISEAQGILDAITKQNVIMQDNIKVLQDMKATEMLSGSANAGQEIKPRTDNDVVNDQAKAMLAGSGYEDIELNQSKVLNIYEHYALNRGKYTNGR